MSEGPQQLCRLQDVKIYGAVVRTGDKHAHALAHEDRSDLSVVIIDLFKADPWVA